MAVNFYLDKRTDKKGEAPIRISIIIRGVRFLTSTGLKISPRKWDAAKQMVKKGSINSMGLLWTAINGTLARITEHFVTYEGYNLATDNYPDRETLKLEFVRNFGRYKKKYEILSSVNGVAEFLDIFIKEMCETNNWSPGTRVKFVSLKKHLNEFKSNLTFADLDNNGLTAFMSFLRDKKCMKNITIGKQWGFLKWYLRWATSRGHNTNTSFQTFSPKLKTTPKKVIFLDWQELMKVYNFRIPANQTEVTLNDANGKSYTKTVYDRKTIALTRDIFCFCCFTSLRYSDAINLKQADISDNNMTITTVKTADTITIELNKYAMAILERYQRNSDSAGRVFPYITIQRMNIFLKELCELCEINQPVTQTYYRGSVRHDVTSPKYELIGTHAGRRTFICNALMLGIPAEIVMKWTGHSDYKAMKPYIDVTNAAKALAMKKFNDL